MPKLFSCLSIMINLSETIWSMLMEMYYWMFTHKSLQCPWATTILKWSKRSKKIITCEVSKLNYTKLSVLMVFIHNKITFIYSINQSSCSWRFPWRRLAEKIGKYPVSCCTERPPKCNHNDVWIMLQRECLQIHIHLVILFVYQLFCKFVTCFVLWLPKHHIIGRPNY